MRAYQHHGIDIKSGLGKQVVYQVIWRRRLVMSDENGSWRKLRNCLAAF